MKAKATLTEKLVLALYALIVLAVFSSACYGIQKWNKTVLELRIKAARAIEQGQSLPEFVTANSNDQQAAFEAYLKMKPLIHK